MKTQKAITTVLVVGMVLGLGLVGTSSAALVATDLNTGGADTGFSGGWQGSNNVFIVTAPDLTYANYSVTQTGTTDRVYSGNTNHTDRMDSRDLAAAMSGDIWFSALVNGHSGQSPIYRKLTRTADPGKMGAARRYQIGIAGQIIVS